MVQTLTGCYKMQVHVCIGKCISYTVTSGHNCSKAERHELFMSFLPRTIVTGCRGIRYTSSDACVRLHLVTAFSTQQSIATTYNQSLNPKHHQVSLRPRICQLNSSTTTIDKKISLVHLTNLKKCIS